MGHQTGVPARTPLIHLGSRYFGHLHGVSMYPRLFGRIPKHELSWGHSIATVRKRHQVLLVWIDGHSAPRIHHAGHILGLLGPATKHGEVLGCRHQIVLRGIRAGFCSAGHPRRLAPHPIPWTSSVGGKTSCSQLAASNNEDRGPPWGMAGSASFP